MDGIAGKIEEQVVMQIGSVSYQPKNARYFSYTSFQDNLCNFENASMIVGHCGIGTILNALTFQKPIIVVPRRIKYGELNRDDHQMEIAQRLVENELVKVVYEVEDLEPAVKEMLAKGRQMNRQRKSLERDALTKTLKDFVDRCP